MVGLGLAATCRLIWVIMLINVVIWNTAAVTTTLSSMIMEEATRKVHEDVI